uniref:alpha-1,2-mannosyltransferase ALG9 isoform X1 n=1 Tax=Myxine glutinosa TaxID=7769 RepID=UPI0035901F93
MASRSRKRGSSAGKVAGKAEGTVLGQVAELEADPSERTVHRSTGVSAAQIWAPGAATAFKLLLSARFCAALLSNISDCDETFNYWEPVHYLLYGQGFQTWEYSPAYALRSYAYLWLLALPGWLHAHVLGANKILVFYFMRCLLAFGSCLCELYFYRAVCKRFGLHAGRLTLVFLALAPGMFISSAAFLPSSFGMCVSTLASACWFAGRDGPAILATAASAIIGWPFTALLGLPIAVDIVIIRKRYTTFVCYSLLSLLIFLVPVILIDSFYYGRWLCSPLNLVFYNVFTSHGPDLYGTEPWWFYLVNGFLNLNVAFPLAILSLPLSLVAHALLEKHNVQTLGKPFWLTLCAPYLWLGIFGTRPHKEERFIFPIVPLLCLCGAVGLASLQKYYHYVFCRLRMEHYTHTSRGLAYSTILLFAVLSLSRCLALFNGYHAPLDLYPEFQQLPDSGHMSRYTTLCIGKEWHRFPSSFFLPNRWQLEFLQSEFRGQLPRHFATVPDATRVVPPNMNDRNHEEASRYVDLARCDYLVDLDLGQASEREPRYTVDTERWISVVQRPFLDVMRSSRLLRAFYVPFLSKKYTTYGNYSILQARRIRSAQRRVQQTL